MPIQVNLNRGEETMDIQKRSEEVAGMITDIVWHSPRDVSDVIPSTALTIIAPAMQAACEEYHVQKMEERREAAKDFVSYPTALRFAYVGIDRLWFPVCEEYGMDPDNYTGKELAYFKDSEDGTTDES